MSPPKVRITPTQLRCELLELARGLNTETPRLSWGVSGDGGTPTGWHIIAGFDPNEVAAGRGDLWDSDIRDGSARVPVYWGGPPLPRDAKVYWTVRLRDEQGLMSGFAPVAAFYTGLGDADWTAGWIARYFVLPAGRDVPQDTAYDNRFQARPADYMRRSFTADPPKRAFVYASALGLYELYLNGQRIGDDVMAPGWTDYHKRVEYQVHDVTDLLQSGENVLGAILGEGWYSGRIGHNQRRAGNHYGGRPALLCQLHLDYGDGRVERIVSDEDWQTRPGPICYSDFLMGEKYDARLEQADWAKPGADTRLWQPVERFTPDPRAPQLDAARAAPAREVARFAPVSETQMPSGEVIYDFGQNIAGYLELNITAPAGTEIRLRHAERLSDDGTLYTENLRFAVCEDIYICKTGGPERFKPRFTFHGFQYAGISCSALPEHIDVAAIAIGSDLPVCGKIETGHPMLNQLMSNIFWSQRDNFLSVPTDCPQRDERYGWTADAQVFWRTAGYFMDVAAFTEKWMQDIIDGQSSDGVFPDVAPTKPLNPYRLSPQPGAPAWGDAPIILAYDHWCRYGDPTQIKRWWPSLTAWMDVISRENPDGLRRNFVNNNYGDWLSIGPETDRVLINTAYWIRLADLMTTLAAIVGEPWSNWDALAQRLRAGFVAAFKSADGRLTGDTQTAYLLALDFDLLPEPDRPVAARHLKRLLDAANGHLQTGFLGVRHLAPVVADWLGPKAAIDLLLKETYPSWGFSVLHGATTIWERWDGWTPEKGFQSKAMNSFNHYAYGAIGEWVWARLAGIDWDELNPGFATVVMRPLFDPRIGYVKAEYDSKAGTVKSAWHMQDNHSVEWRVELAPGTSAKVRLPKGWAAAQGTEFTLQGGHHVIQVKNSVD